MAAATTDRWIGWIGFIAGLADHGSRSRFLVKPRKAGSGDVGNYKERGLRSLVGLGVSVEL
jgi:hypothetical protein